jgi:8-oxo-dGTP diphosphatase
MPYYIPRLSRGRFTSRVSPGNCVPMASPREYPERPVVGVGGVVIENGRALLIRRGGEPLKGQWSIPGGTLETGETLEEGTRREMEEETGLRVRVVELIEVFERIFPDEARRSEPGGRPRYHFVILDYLCERLSGEARAGGDVTDVAWVAESDLEPYQLTPTATRILKKAFAMSKSRKG